MEFNEYFSCHNHGMSAFTEEKGEYLVYTSKDVKRFSNSICWTEKVHATYEKRNFDSNEELHDVSAKKLKITSEPLSCVPPSLIRKKYRYIFYISFLMLNSCSKPFAISVIWIPVTDKTTRGSKFGDSLVTSSSLLCFVFWKNSIHINRSTKKG